MKNNNSRFELETEGLITFADYHIENNILYIDYVFSPPELRGKGLAPQLMEEITQFAKEKNMKITPICGYAAVWLKKHKEYHDLIKS